MLSPAIFCMTRFKYLQIFTKLDWKSIKVQLFKCSTCHRKWGDDSIKTIGMFDIEVVEQAAFMYLRSVSFNGVIAIIQSWFDKTVFSKDILIDHLERLTSSLPSNQEITAWLKPKCTRKI